MLRKLYPYILFLIVLINFVSAKTTFDGYTIDCSDTDYLLCDDFDDASIDWDKWYSTDQARFAEGINLTITATSDAEDGLYSNYLIFNNTYNYTMQYKFSSSDATSANWYMGIDSNKAWDPEAYIFQPPNAFLGEGGRPYSYPANTNVTFIIYGNVTNSTYHGEIYNEAGEMVDNYSKSDVDIGNANFYFSHLHYSTGGGTVGTYYYFIAWKGLPSDAPYLEEEEEESSNPVWVIPPNDDWKNNTNITMNITHTADVTYTVYLDDALYLDNVSQTENYYLNFTTNLSDGSYSFKVSVQNKSSGLWSNNITRLWTLDTTIPTITIYPNNAFNSSDVSSISQYDDYFFANITVADEIELFGFLINVTRRGISYFNFSNETLTGHTTFNYSTNISTSTWPAGVYDINVSASDAHTLTSIKDYDVKNGVNTITFNTLEGNQIKISSDGSAYSTLYNKKKDRYEFGWQYLLTDSTRKFTLESQNKIHYLPNSRYVAHFVIGSAIKANWLDFEGIGNDYSVKKINDRKYEITFFNLPLSNKIISKSLGGVNVITESFKWYKGNYTTSYSTTPSYSETGTFILNMSSNSSFLSLNSTFNYDGVERNVTKTIASSYTSFVTVIDIPEANDSIQNITFFWGVNVTQSDGGLYSINISKMHTVENFIIYNCTGTTAGINSLNFSLLNESDDSFVSGTMNFLFKYNLSDTYKNYSTSVTGNNMTFCIYPNSTTVTTDITVDFTVDSTTFEYNTLDFVMTNISQLINLYSTSGTTRITFTVTDLFDDPLEEVYIKILKYDVGDNSYKTVEIIKTNNDGEAIGNIILYTEWYRFIIEYQGVTYIVTEPSKIFSTTKVFRIDLTVDDWFANYDTTLGVSTVLNFTNSTLNFRYTWNDPTGAMHQGCLQVVKINRTAEKTICDNCTTSAAATILCYIGPSSKVNGQRFIAQGYLRYDLIYITDILEKIFGGGDFTPLWEKGAEEREFGVFLSFMLIVALTMIGIWSPVTAIVMNLVGFFIVSTLGFLKLQIGALITLVILGIIVIYRISKR